MDLRLRPGLHFCQSGDLAIFLDVPSDRYFALTETLSAAFLRLAAGTNTFADEPAIDRLLGTVLVRGDGGPLIPAVAPTAPTCSVWDRPADAAPGKALHAMAALVRARWTLRRRKLEGSLGQLARRKAGMAPGASDPDAIAAVGAAFRMAARYLSANDLCLPHSLAVATELYRHGLPATFVIGVIARPFQAHCWVQAGDLLANDRVDTVRDFTPILVI